MRKSFGGLLLYLILTTQYAHAATVWYQPTPYPASVIVTMTDSATHFSEGWLLTDENWNPLQQQNGSYLQQDDWLCVGGMDAKYRCLTYLKLNLTGLPRYVDSAYFWLVPGSISSPWVSSKYAVCSNIGTWGVLSSWYAIPTVNQCIGWYSAPVAGSWAGFWVSGSGDRDWYNKWQDGTLANNGVVIFSQNATNGLNIFVSSRYQFPYDGDRPILQLTFTPTLELKMPLPGNHTWLVTTEIGGWDCKGKYDSAHDNNNYFSIDFSWKNVADSGATTYTETSNIPVIAVAGGMVVKATPPNAPDANNGHHVVLNHSGGTTNTGFTTRYLHLQPPGPTVTEGQTVQQGDTIGYMGNTGISDGTHLHFGVRYNNSGSSTVPETAKVVMDGWLLKSFQTECAVNGSGVPTNFIRYYRSGNRVY